MPTFAASVEPYDLHQLSIPGGDRGWIVDPSGAAVLVHDLLPYYVDILPSMVREVVVSETQRLVDWAHEHSIPVVASAPRPASVLEERGLGGRLWGVGPSQAETLTTCLPKLGDALWIGKRSYSAFFGTDLSIELRRLSRDQLIIAGVFASAGILATTFDALANDIEAFVVINATADYDRTNTKRPFGRSPPRQAQSSPAPPSSRPKAKPSDEDLFDPVPEADDNRTQFHAIGSETQDNFSR